MVSSNITVSHADTGLMVAEVVRAEQISPHMVRVTVQGEALRDLRVLGFDQWFRLAVPTTGGARFDNMSDRFDIGGFLKYLTLPRATRPTVRNYTIREARPQDGEIDIDMLVHGADGVAGPWAATLPVGDQVGIIDQGCGYRDLPADTTVLVGDESALPAIVGILRDLDRGTTGVAIIEVPDIADAQHVDAPLGMDVRWLAREPRDTAGVHALEELRDAGRFHGKVTAFAAGESKLATGARRHFVNTLGVPKERVTFSGYWRARNAA